MGSNSNRSAPGRSQRGRRPEWQSALLGGLAAALLLSCAPRLEGPVLRLQRGDGSIHQVAIEEYLAGVLLAEVGANWPEEALKAQAVAARSFAWQRRQAQRGRGTYDLREGVLDQAYQAQNSYPASIQRAVDATRGEVLVYDREPIQALYHGSCGGHTAAASQIFGGHEIAYLKGVPCPFCQGAPKFFWRVERSRQEWQEALGLDHRVEKNWGAAVYRRDPHGRALQVEIAGQLWRAEELRRRAGFQVLRSNFFEIRSAGDKIIFSGRGAGHGVGLCQWGSRRQALAGWAYRRILAYYYPGSEVEKRF